MGDEPCVIIDVTPARPAPAAGDGAQRVQCHPCGVEFLARRPDQAGELVAAVQQHARGSHGQDVTREHILAELAPA